jgi:hypothetical protein
MALTPGLRPFSEDRPSVGGRNTGRVQVEDNTLRPQRLRPAAGPVDTFERPTLPEKSTGPSDLEQIASALGQLNPALQRFAAVSAPEYREDADARVNKKLAGMTTPDVVKTLKERTDPEITNYFGNAKGQQLLANRLASQTVEEATREYLTSESRDGINIDQFIAERKKKVLDEYGGDKHFSEAFLEAVSPGLEKLRGAQGQYLTDKVKGEQLGGIFATFKNTIDNHLSQGGKVEEVFPLLQKEMQGNKLVLNMPFKEQQAELLKLAGMYADQGRKDVVETLLKSERTSPDGNHGSLLTDRDFTAKASDILTTADSKSRQNNQRASFDTNMKFVEQANRGELKKDDLIAYYKANPGAMSDSHVTGLVTHDENVRKLALEKAQKLEREAAVQRTLDAQANNNKIGGVMAISQGRLLSLPGRYEVDRKGEQSFVEPEKAQKQAVNDWLEHSQNAAKQAGETPEQRFARELPVVRQNGFVHPQWQAELKQGAASAAVPTLTGEKVPEAFAAGYGKYKQLRAHAPELLKDLVPGTAGEFYEMVRVGEEELGQAPDKAFLNALTATRPSEGNFKSDALRTSRKEVEKKVNGMEGWALFGGVGNVENKSYIQGETQRIAEYYLRMGVNSDRAIELAADRIKQTHANIHGWMVDVSDRRTPPNFKDLVEKRLNEYAQKNGKAEGIDASDLAIRPEGNGFGSWTIINRKEGGAAVDDRASRTFTISDLLKAQQATDNVALDAIANKNSQRAPTAPSARNGATFRDIAREKIGLPERNFATPKGGATPQVGETKTPGATWKSPITGATYKNDARGLPTMIDRGR